MLNKTVRLLGVSEMLMVMGGETEREREGMQIQKINKNVHRNRQRDKEVKRD